VDNRVRVEITKEIDLAQLDAELGGHGLCGSDTEIVSVEGSPVTQEQLLSAVKAHVYVDADAVKVAARESAMSKLAALGLSVSEVEAIVGSV